VIGGLVEATWDVIVIGAGLGGGIAGRRLAEAGARVLFLERGPLHPRDEERDWLGEISDPAARMARGYWPERIEAVVDGRTARPFAPLGTGVGGTSLFYAAMLERPERHELEDVPGMVHPTGGWPGGYDALLPYLASAEELLSVCGEPDPLASDATSSLRPPPALSGGDNALMAELRRSGLHPYRKHVGVRYLPGCAECFGRMCARACKMDGRSAGVEPALATGRAALIDRCEVLALAGSPRSVDEVVAERNGQILRLKARQVVLAAGGLNSPRLLLASAGEAWPGGCANRSGLVGRNLMFHLNERFAFWPGRRIDVAPPFGAVSLRDFYRGDGVRLGHVHAMGLQADYGSILHYLRARFDASVAAPVRPLRGMLLGPALAAQVFFGRAQIFVGLLEDMPLPDNRVRLDPSHPRRLRFEYKTTGELRARRRAFRARIRRGFGRRRTVFLNHEPELNIAHCCGTLRFGTDPATSVLDPSCRAHEIDNLYVADGSFMPTSNGINPSLTIAANALRVAEAMIAARGVQRTVPSNGF
jgi:choline dehydrogenase-like flavoprotein